MPTTYICFEPIEWIQEIRDDPSINVRGRYLQTVEWRRTVTYLSMVRSICVNLRQFQSASSTVLRRRKKCLKRRKIKRHLERFLICGTKTTPVGGSIWRTPSGSLRSGIKYEREATRTAA